MFDFLPYFSDEYQYWCKWPGYTQIYTVCYDDGTNLVHFTYASRPVDFNGTTWMSKTNRIWSFILSTFFIPTSFFKCLDLYKYVILFLWSFLSKQWIALVFRNWAIFIAAYWVWLGFFYNCNFGFDPNMVHSGFGWSHWICNKFAFGPFVHFCF